MEECIIDPRFRDELSSSESGRIMLEALRRQADGFGVFGPDFQILYANAQSVRRFRSTYEALRAGKTMREAVRASVAKSMPSFDDEQVEAATSAIYQAMLAGQTIDLRTEEGGVAQVTYKPMSEGRRVAISTDLTALRAREKELREARRQADAANASKSSFLANTSHEIRTPLNAILGLAQVLEKQDLPAPARGHVSSILDAGKTLTALLNDVLDLSKIEAGKLEIAPVDADVGHALRRLLRLWRPRAEEKGLELSLALDAELPPVLHFDPVRVRQCVSNLISNAIKFTEKGSVDIAVKAKRLPKGDYLVTVRVADTGIGVEKEALQKLFQPFAQADASTSREYGGTGLGLAITRKLAEQMGGEASAESIPGHGSVFSFAFRARPAQAAARETPASDPVAAVAARASLRGLKALIVDDIPINRQVAGLFLRPLGCVITEAANGAAALDLLTTEHFDFVLLDMHMPVMDGPTTICEIRSRNEAWSGIKVIALTADAMSGDRERYLGLGMNGYLAKPLSEAELVTEIQRVLAVGDADSAAPRAVLAG